MRAGLRALALLTSVVIPLSGCSAQTAVDTTSRGYPAALVKELASLKQSSGLFSEPGGSAIGWPSLYSTALYARAGLLDPAGPVAPGALDPSEPATVGPTLYTWAYVTDAGATAAAPVQLPALAGISTALPSPSDDENDIGLLWAWADTATRVAPAPPAAAFDAARQRLESIDAAELSSPYLLWRLSAALALVGGKSSPALDAALSAAHTRPPLPGRADSIHAVLDTQGYLELAVATGRGVPGGDELLDRLRAAVRSVPPDDDLTRSSLLRSIRLLGSSDVNPLDQLASRRDAETGLLRQVVTVAGSIEATYLVAQLVPQDFPAIAGSSTRAALAEFLTKHRAAPPLDRLRAIAALKMSGDAEWRDYRAEVEHAEAALASLRVEADALESVVLEIDALWAIDVSAVPKPVLTEFPLTDSHSEYLAMVTLGNRSMFANAAEIGGWFPALQSGLIQRAEHPEEPLRPFYSALFAITSSPLATLTPEVSAAIGQGLRSLHGCTGYPELYRTSISDRGACALLATRLAIASSFAYS